MPYSTLFFDLDNTLYSGNGLWDVIRERMSVYMIERLGLPADQVPALRRMYFETYGTTLRGLQLHFNVDADEYLAYVHNLPLEQYLRPDSRLRDLLLSLPQRRWVFTNADDDHAHRVLHVMGLEGCFAGIIDVRALNFACKPEPEAYQRALALAEEAQPVQCVIFDDSPRNLAAAQEQGFTTALVGANTDHCSADYCLANLLDLPSRMPQLWGEEADLRPAGGGRPVEGSAA